MVRFVWGELILLTYQCPSRQHSLVSLFNSLPRTGFTLHMFHIENPSWILKFWNYTSNRWSTYGSVLIWRYVADATAWWTYMFLNTFTFTTLCIHFVFVFLLQLSLADLALYDRLQLTIDMFEFSLDKYPKTAANRAKVAELPRIAEWLKKRPVSQY